MSARDWRPGRGARGRVCDAGHDESRSRQTRRQLRRGHGVVIKEKGLTAFFNQLKAIAPRMATRARVGSLCARIRTLCASAQTDHAVRTGPSLWSAQEI